MAPSRGNWFSKLLARKRRLGFGLALAAPLVWAGAAAAFERGINVNPWFTIPATRPGASADTPLASRFADPPFPTYTDQSYRAELAKIAASGFDFIRVPITPGPFLVMDPAARRASFANIRTVLETARAQGLELVINLHAGSTVAFGEIARDEASRRRYVQVLLDLVAVIGELGPEHVLFEVINEPSGPCVDPVWTDFQDQILLAVSEEHPDARMMVTGSCWSAVEGLVELRPSDLPIPPDRLYFTFHFYAPYVFTHQGNNWSGEPGNQVVTGLAWPPAAGNLETALARIRATAPTSEGYARHGPSALRQAEEMAATYYQSDPGPGSITADFDRVAAWARANSIPAERVILGEFGVLKQERQWQGADMASAARWIRAVREAAEARGMPWAMWSYDQSMALTVSDGDLRWHEPIAAALGIAAAPIGTSP